MANPWANRLNGVAKATTETEIKTAVRIAIANNAATDAILEGKQTPEILTPEEVEDSPEHIEVGKLSRLVDDDFPFDDSQLAAIHGMISERYACLTGAAGTGKTTTTKKLVDELQKQSRLNLVNMSEYFKKEASIPGDDDYEIPKQFIPAVALVGFTGRSSQMIKKNFPRDWHGNIMTIHRLLAFVPEYYDEWDDDSQQIKKKMRFAPTYTAEVKLPWDIVIIDEAGMVGLDLWHQLWAAMKPGARIYMIGDINQLPPVHGRSVFGFAMASWPSWELTHIHRQVGANNAIVENAWRILNGQLPESGGKFQMVELKGDAVYSSRQVRAMIPKLQEKGIYDPIRDTIITAINGEDGARGYALGQLPLNQEFATIFNPALTNPRYIIDGGRERKQFAVGDKVMATKNDYESGITNGMTGIITSIVAHPGYAGDIQRFGLVEDVNRFLAAEDDEPEDEFSLDDLHDSMDAIDSGQQDAKEKRERGPASHLITVEFGTGTHAFRIEFATLSEVGSLMTAYVVTCHKMQGGESPTVVVIVHDALKAMMDREWLYTAVTRASSTCILLYTPTALRTAINKQRITGKTLAEKIKVFNLLQTNRGMGAAVKVTLPEAETQLQANQVALYEPKPIEELAEQAEASVAPWEDVPEEVEWEVIQPKVEPKPEPSVIHVHHHTTVIHMHDAHEPAPWEDEPDEDVGYEVAQEHVESQLEAPEIPLLPAPPPKPWIESHGFWYAEQEAEEAIRFDYGYPAFEDPEYPLAPALPQVAPKRTNPWAKKIGVQQ